MQFIHAVYGFLLSFFPKSYREEYGEELQVVFELSLEEAARKGGFEVEKLIVRELVSLPKAVFLEYLREWRSAAMKRSFESYFVFPSGSWKEFLMASLPFFLVGGLMPVLYYLGRTGVATNAVSTTILLALFGLILLFLALGVKMGIPRWSLPYLGFLFSFLSAYLFSAVFGTPIYLLFGDFRGSSLFIDLLWGGIFWYGLLTILFVLVVLTRSSSTFRYFKSDWTQLSFIAYGAVPFGLTLTFDEYVGDEPYMLFVFLVLAVGAWIYLRGKGDWNRFAVLFLALTLAVAIVAVGKAVLIPKQDWPFPLDSGLIRAEVKNTIIMWFWFALGMLVPLGVKYLPRSTSPTQISPSEG